MPVLILRAYDDGDTRLTFGPLGHDGPAGGSMALDEGLPGSESVIGASELLADGVEATALPGEFGSHWHEHHTDAIDLYRKIMGPERIFGDGVIVDTMEVAGLWRSVGDLHAGVGAVFDEHAEMWGCHLSHPYRSGGSLYFTFLLRDADDESVRARYRECWEAAIGAAHRAGGTMTHHHGVGLLRAPYLAEELGREGFRVLAAIKNALDPTGIMNPGKLLPEE